MILTKEQIEIRLTSEKNISNKITILKDHEVIIKDGKNHFGKLGSKNLTENERIAIGVLASTVGEEVTSELFGISETTAHKLKYGMRSGDSGASHLQDQELKNKIDERLNKTKLSIEERAAEKLLTSLNLITEDKLENASVRDLAQISNQMSQVLRNSSRNNGAEGVGMKVQIIVNQPKQAKEDSFDCIELVSK